MSLQWLETIVAEAHAKLAHPDAPTAANPPTAGQLTELAHMLEALGVTVEGKVAGAVTGGAAALAQAPTGAIESAIAGIRTEVEGQLGEVFKAWAEKQVTAFAELRAEVDAQLGPITSLFSALQHLQPAAAAAAAGVTGAAPQAPTPAQPGQA